MNDDLHRALSQIADGAADHSARRAPAGLHPATLVAGARRRRRRSQAQAVGTGVVASLALGAGGLAVAGAFPDDGRSVEEFDGTPTAFVRELPGCFEALETDPEVGDGWLVDVRVPDLAVGTAASVDVRLGMITDGEYVAQGARHRGATVLLVQDGVVVGLVERAGATEREVEAALDAQDDLGFTGDVVTCGDIELEDGTYEAHVALELRPEWYELPDGNVAVTDAVYGWHVVEPVDVEVTDRTWSDVAESELRPEVPLVAGRVVESRVHTTGDRWRATVEVEGLAGDEAYPAVETLLLDAGFTLVGERESDGTSTTATFTGGGIEVVVQVDLSNGAYASYDVTAGGDGEA